MWVLRVLNGPHSGKIFPLKPGRNRIGRGAHCDISIPSSGISKEHAQIEIQSGKMMITDLQSRNGTLVNGVRVQSQQIRAGDKVALYDVLFDVIPATAARPQSPHTPPPQMGWGQGQPGSPYDSAAMPPGFSTAPMNLQADGANLDPAANAAPQLPTQSFMAYVHHYIEHVAMPGVYRLTELSDFRTVIALMVIVLVVATSALSTIIMVQVSRESVVNEAMRRTSTLAKMLQEANRAAIQVGRDSDLDTSQVSKEEGVSEAMIVAADGGILAPARKIGTYSKNPFVPRAIRMDRNYTERTTSSEIGAAAPIFQFDEQLGKQVIKAYAIVIYELKALAIDDSQFIILFMKTLLLAALVGFVVAYFLMRITEHPLEALNRQFDKALREGSGTTETPVNLPALQVLVNNINSALARRNDSGGSAAAGTVYVDRDAESQNLVQLIGLPAMVVDGPDEIIKFMNREFEQITGLSFANLQRQALAAITDGALRLSLQDLVARVRQQPNLIAADALDFSGDNYELCIQAVQSNQGIAYFLVILQPEMNGASHQAGGF